MRYFKGLLCVYLVLVLCAVALRLGATSGPPNCSVTGSISCYECSSNPEACLGCPGFSASSQFDDTPSSGCDGDCQGGGTTCCNRSACETLQFYLIGSCFGFYKIHTANGCCDMCYQ